MALKGLIIRQPWIDLILSGQKTWEMRSRGTTVRGPIALIEKGTGTVVGLANLEDSLPPLPPGNMPAHFQKHRVPQDLVEAPGFNWLTPWVVTQARRLGRPVHYRHKSGAVIWVELDPEVVAAVLGATNEVDRAGAVPSGRSVSAKHAEMAQRAIHATKVPIPLDASTTITRRGNKLYIDVEWDDGLPARQNGSGWSAWAELIGTFAAFSAMICLMGFVIHFGAGMTSSSISALSAFKWVVPMTVSAFLATALGQGHLLEGMRRKP